MLISRAVVEAKLTDCETRLYELQAAREAEMEKPLNARDHMVLVFLESHCRVYRHTASTLREILTESE